MIRCTLALLAILIAGIEAHAADLTVTVTDLTSDKGSVGVSVVNSADAWDGKAAAVDRQRLPISGKQLTVSFANLPPGEYAVMVMHDENGNGELDFNALGMPSEAYGFSNNPEAFGKPRYDAARFTLGADGGAITIRLQ